MVGAMHRRVIEGYVQVWDSVDDEFNVVAAISTMDIASLTF
jgi:hypothetical protein